MLSTHSPSTGPRSCQLAARIDHRVRPRQLRCPSHLPGPSDRDAGRRTECGGRPGVHADASDVLRHALSCGRSRPTALPARSTAAGPPFRRRSRHSAPNGFRLGAVDAVVRAEVAQRSKPHERPPVPWSGGRFSVPQTKRAYPTDRLLRASTRPDAQKRKRAAAFLAARRRGSRPLGNLQPRFRACRRPEDEYPGRWRRGPRSLGSRGHGKAPVCPFPARAGSSHAWGYEPLGRWMNRPQDRAEFGGELRGPVGTMYSTSATSRCGGSCGRASMPRKTWHCARRCRSRTALKPGLIVASPGVPPAAMASRARSGWRRSRVAGQGAWTNFTDDEAPGFRRHRRGNDAYHPRASWMATRHAPRR